MVITHLFRIEIQYLNAPYLSTNGPCTLTYTAIVGQGGPAPVLGAMASPSAAANQVWGSTISGIAGSFGNILGSAPKA